MQDRQQRVESSQGLLEVYNANPEDFHCLEIWSPTCVEWDFWDDDELKAATEAWFEDQIDDFYFKGIDCLKEKWAKCIEVKGDYIEK